MFDHHCTACDQRQLIFPSQVTSVVNTDHGIVVRLHLLVRRRADLGAHRPPRPRRAGLAGPHRRVTHA